VTAAQLVRHLPARLLHRLRRRKVLAQLQARALPRSVLIVCHGNVCRSPYAAARLRKLLPAALAAKIHVESAGFLRPDRPPPVAAVVVAEARGVDLSEHRSRMLGSRDVSAADLILVMDPAQQKAVNYRFGRREGVMVLGDLDPEPNTRRAIRDPIEQPASVFEESYARIDRCLRLLVSIMSSVGGGVGGEGKARR